MQANQLNDDPRLGEAIEAAAAAVRAGGVVAYPTETYYALGADPRNPDALDAVSRLKGRDSEVKPLLLLVDSLDAIAGWVSALPPQFAVLAASFWPGPLTLVLPASESVAAAVTGGGTGVAVRWSSHRVARRLIRACGGALTGTSANHTGEPPADTLEAAVTVFGDGLDMALDGGQTPGGPPSTLLDLSGAEPRVLRPGAVSEEAIIEVLRLL